MLGRDRAEELKTRKNPILYLFSVDCIVFNCVNCLVIPRSCYSFITTVWFTKITCLAEIQPGDRLSLISLAKLKTKGSLGSLPVGLGDSIDRHSGWMKIESSLDSYCSRIRT